MEGTGAAVYAYEGRRPQIDRRAFVAPGAFVAGDVVIGPEASVWFTAVVRGDSSYVRVGARTNIHDGAVLHTDPGKPCLVGASCTIGHRAIVHGCTVGDGCLIGMGAVVLSGAVIGDESLVGAGAIVPEGAVIAPRSLVLGVPGKVRRTLTEEEVERLVRPGVGNYLRYAEAYRRSVAHPSAAREDRRPAGATDPSNDEVLAVDASRDDEGRS
jgi:carbonic anhydrase/acetyltransferase-like protein (isoleucine patch superfamily)